MDHHTMRRLWIKAAVEHRVVRLEYHDPTTGGDVTTRDVDPDFIGSWLGLGYIFPWYFRFWGASDDSKGGGLCCFKPRTVISLRITGRTFEPRPDGLWMVHLEEYHRSGLGEETG